MKKILRSLGILVAAFIVTSFMSCEKKSADVKTDEKVQAKKVVASTSWTAAFADLAGVDEVEIIAPANLRHPPEYEITVEDIKTITESDVFVFAGFERMMKTLGDAVGDVEMIKITCDNSISTVSSSAMTIAEKLGTQKICNDRVLKYANTIYDAKKKLEEKNLSGAKVMCNKNQTYLANDLGLEIVEIFGPGPLTVDQINFAASNEIDFVIDNVHNPVADSLTEVNSNAKYIVWRNFPEIVEHDALIKVVSDNIAQLMN